MHTGTKYKLQSAAMSIEKFRNLSLQEQEWLFPMLSKSIQSTLKLLDVISNQRKTFEEIADLMGCNPQTVSQKINALIEAGLAIDLSATGAIAPTGRPRKLACR